MQAIAAEVSSARIKFPAPNKNMTALTEEVGELAKALLEYDGSDRDEIEKEAVQVAAMAIRVLEEGDPTLDVPPLRSMETGS